MYMTQVQSNILFSTVRISLQVSTIFLISRLASRTYNLTYLERINGGFVSRVNYLFFTEFSPNHKHSLGRLYVFLALVTMTFTYLSSLLSGLYPIQPTNLSTHLQRIDLNTTLLQTTSLTPGLTSPDNILSDMGLSLNGAKFHNYSLSPPPPNLCKVIDKQSVDCSGDIWTDSTTQYEEWPVIFAHNTKGLTEEDTLLRNGITQSGESFQYFNASASKHGGAVVDMYNYLDFSTLGEQDVSTREASRSLESCLFRGYDTRRCVRHSVSYFFPPTRNRIGLINRRAVFQSISGNNASCDQFSTLAARTLCGYLDGLERSHDERVYATQQRTSDSNGRIHWDVVSLYMHSQHLYFEAFSLDTSITVFNITKDDYRWEEVVKQVDSISYPDLYLSGEVFEATYFVPENLNQLNHTWASWGFSSNDLSNLTHFLLGGTLMNNGAIFNMPPLQLANVSEVTIGLLFGASLIMFALGLAFSRGTPSAICNPISEVLYEAMAAKKEKTTLPSNKSSSILTSRKRQVANLKWVPQLDGGKEQDSSNATTDHELLTEQVQQSRPPRQLRHTFTLHIGIDSDDEDEDTIQLLETI
ncbi:hypothetical protein BGX24_001981 [Mortierella sp. AD032]|nr:hypothetical protein BGX24_001981 [Mortierella sp. AD032]